MKQVKGVQYSIILLLLINFLTIIYNGALYIQITNYVISKGQMTLLLGELNNISNHLTRFFGIQLFFLSVLFLYLPIKCIQLRKNGQFFQNGICLK